jgi:hypothetical protein
MMIFVGDVPVVGESKCLRQCFISNLGKKKKKKKNLLKFRMTVEPVKVLATKPDHISSIPRI